MARRKFRILRIGGWVIMGIFSLILITVLVFYLGRDYFLSRAVSYLNDQQPGEVQVERINLIPFLNFPNITLQLREVNFYEGEQPDESVIQQPVLSMEEIGVTLDLIALIKGSVMVSEASLENGLVHMKVYADSVSNLEHALGIRFGTQREKEPREGERPLNIDLEKMELLNVRVLMDNQLRDEHVSMKVNRFESSFSYRIDEIHAGLEVDIEIDSVKYQTINGNIDKNFRLKGSVVLHPESGNLQVEPSSLSVSGLELDTWGNLDYGGGYPRLDFAYTASNEGLELLNFLFRGVLDLEEIEQIGEGSIHLNGTVQGVLGNLELPVIRMNGSAEELGFRIKALDRDVTGISFQLFATNGSSSDLSEAYIDVRDFKASFPEGNIKANITANNIKSPELNIEVDGDLNLEGLDEMFQNEFLSELSGKMSIMGQLGGNVEKTPGGYLKEGGSLSAILKDVSCVIHRDSLSADTIGGVSGEFVLRDSILGTENLVMEINGNRLELALNTENLLLYLLDYDRTVRTELTISSDLLHPASLFQDSSISKMLGEEINGLYLDAKAVIEKKELDDFLQRDSIPELEILLDSFGISLPWLAGISDVSASLSFGPDSLVLHRFEGTIGKSSIGFTGKLANYEVLLHPDSGGVVILDFNIVSDLIQAEDLLTINQEFLLPQTYSTEQLKDFKLAGRLEAPAAGLVYDSVPADFSLDINDLDWGFRYYPDRFKDFLIRIKREDNVLFIDHILGSIGDINLNLSAELENFNDSLLENIHGNLELYADLLDVNQLLNYQLTPDSGKVQGSDTTELHESPKLSEMAFPNIEFTVDIGELRYGRHTISGINGKFRTSKEKILYLDQLVTSPEGKGTLGFNGQLNLSDPELYSISAELDLEGIDINDLNLELQSGDTIMAMKDHFYGIADAKGLAEIFLTPELKVDISTSTAAFDIMVTNGALINFTPLQAAGKYLDSKDLNNVRFDTVRNSFTLMDSQIHIPVMNVESTLGQLLIQGEQGLDGSYLYLVHVPKKLARAAARSALSEGSKEDGEDQMNQMERGDFYMMTVWSNGKASDFKLGDRRNKFQE